VKSGGVVVCGIDGSGTDAATVEVAAQLALLARAELALIAVAPRPGLTLEEARTLLAATADGLRDRVEVECHLDSGDPLHRLAEFAARKRALLLVVGTRTPVPCPVVAVPEASLVGTWADA
jgi:hypothetical protein